MKADPLNATTMNFTLGSYHGSLVLNPQDIILRFEHTSTARIYEQTYFERDFPDVMALGGLEFVGKLLDAGFKADAASSVTVTNLKESSAKLSMDIIHANPIFVRPLTISFTIPAIRKQTGTSDVDALTRKVKEMSDSFATTLETRLAALELLSARIGQLEQRCSRSIILPGCAYAIPVDVQSLILIRNQSSLPNGDTYWCGNPGMKCPGHYPDMSAINWTSPFTYGHYTMAWTASPQPAYTHTGITSINNLIHLHRCTSLMLSGVYELSDFSILGQMPNLRNLSIVGGRKYQQGQPVPYASDLETYVNPAGGQRTAIMLRDISWIRELKKLTSVSFLGCTALSDITPLCDLPALRELDIRETAVQNTAFLTNAALKITR
jgi:hypothetical protein